MSRNKLSNKAESESTVAASSAAPITVYLSEKEATYQTLTNRIIVDNEEKEIRRGKLLGDEGRRHASNWAQAEATNSAVTGMNNIRLSLDERSRAYKEANPSGVGYAQFMQDSYKQLYEEETRTMRSPEAANMLRQSYVSSSSDIAIRSAETEIVQGRDYQTIESKKNCGVLCSRVLNNPSEYKQLSSEHNAMIESYRPIMGEVFPKLEGELKNEFECAYVNGLIKNNTDQARNYLKKTNVWLTPKDVASFYNQCRNQDAANLSSVRERESYIKKLDFNAMREFEASVEYAQITGDKSFVPENMIEEMVRKGRVSEIGRKELYVRLQKIEDLKRSDILRQDSITNAIAEKTVLPVEASPDDVVKHFYESVKEADQQAATSGRQKMTLLDKRNMISNAPLVYGSVVNQTFCNEIKTTLRTTKIGENLEDACLACSEARNTDALNALSEEDILFAKSARALYAATGSYSSLLTFRDSWFKDRNESEKKLLEKNWNATMRKAGTKNKQEALIVKNVMRHSGQKFVQWIPMDIIPSSMTYSTRKEIVDNVKEVYMRSGGDIEFAEGVVGSLMKESFGTQNVTGEEERVFKPATPETLGIKQSDIINSVAANADRLFDALDATTPIKDRPFQLTKERYIAKGTTAESLKDKTYYEADKSRSSKMEVSVKIDGKDQKRLLRIDSTPLKGVYNFYIYLNEKDKKSKYYLYDPRTNSPATCRLIK